jgi:hypothetical protein
MVRWVSRVRVIAEAMVEVVVGAVTLAFQAMWVMGQNFLPFQGRSVRRS